MNTVDSELMDLLQKAHQVEPEIYAAMATVAGYYRLVDWNLDVISEDFNSLDKVKERLNDVVNKTRRPEN